MKNPCPHCHHDLTEEQLFDLLNRVLSRRASQCRHLELESDPRDPLVEICLDCGFCRETRPI